MLSAGRDVTVGEEAEMIPLHFDPMGQQAIFLASSSAHTAEEEQHAAP